MNCASLLIKCELFMNKKIKPTADLAPFVANLTQLDDLFISDYERDIMDEEFLLHFTILTHLRKLTLMGRRIQVDNLEELFQHLSDLQCLELWRAASESEEWGIFEYLEKLRRLRLHECFGPRGFGILESLKELALIENNSMEPEDFVEINDLTNLTRLSVQHIWNLEDAMFEQLNSLPSLNELVVSSETSRKATNRMLNTICEKMTNLTNLTWLPQASEYEDHPPISSITILNELRFLFLNGSVLDGDVHYLHQLPNLTALAVLGVTNDEMVQQIIKLTNLRGLTLSGDFDYRLEYFASSMPNVRDLKVY